MGNEKCKNLGNDLSRGKEAIHGPRMPRGALGHLPWGEAERLLWLARSDDVSSTPIQAISRHASTIYDDDMHNTIPESVKSGRQQTRLAVRFVGAVPVDQDGIFVPGQLHWIPKRPRIVSAVVSGGEQA
ncbi:hypothetical protein CRG98_001971 [Punica granatum]|uniref:Uncharacterized protein n=1 Tax=Punica granatum TaxID=22663 RepID=A0A2I0LAB7_PUNGR|nr:hypothetical protein CRG98_001971 [Punica granatum]